MELVFYRPIKLALIIYCILGIACLVCGYMFFSGYLKTGSFLLGIYFLGFASFQTIMGNNKIATLEANCLRLNVDGKTEIPIDLGDIESISISEIDKFIPNPNTIHPNKVPMPLPVVKIQLKNNIEISNESIKTKVTRSVPVLNNWELTPDLKTVHIFQRPKGGFDFFLKKVMEAKAAL